jgi:hypothetical protein
MGTSAWPANSVRSLSSMRINMKLLLLLVAVLLVAASVAASLSVAIYVTDAFYAD